MGRTSDARQRLIDATHDLIWEYSYGAVTIDAICERAAVKKGSFYYFFDSKADLALVAIDDWWTERQKVFKDVFREEIPPLERMRKYLDLVADHQCKAYENSGQVLGCPLFTLGSEISTQDERLRTRIHEILMTGTSYFEQAIADAQARGEVEGHDAPLKARKLVSYYEGLLTRARIENSIDQIRGLSAEVLTIIGIQPVLVALQSTFV
jgi:TetR/AcrR family transcriptional repressor of nem operon